MGEEFILPVCPQILLRGPLDRGDPYGFKDFVGDCPEEDYQFFRAFVESGRTCAVLAWDGFLLVGAITFYPQKTLKAGIGKVYGTVDYPEDLWRGLPSDSFTVVVGCVTVAKGYRGMGIASGLAEEMIKQARKDGWKRILVTGVQTEVVGYDHRLALPFWESLGFKIIRVNDRVSLMPTWASRMKEEIMRKHEMGEYLVEGIDFSFLLRSMGWNGILATYDLELKIG